MRRYVATVRDLRIESPHEHGGWKNNRVENLHQPTRRRERKMLLSRALIRLVCAAKGFWLAARMSQKPSSLAC